LPIFDDVIVAQSQDVWNWAFYFFTIFEIQMPGVLSDGVFNYDVILMVGKC